MPTLADEMNLDSLYSLFKGEPGTRKSTCALSFPGPQYWFSYDQKMNALLLPMKNFGIKPSDISYDDYADWNEGLKKLKSFQVDCKYKTIVIDSITSVGDGIMRQTRQMKTGQTRQSGQAAGMRIAGIQVNELEDYNAESAALGELIAITKDIHKYHKVNVILIAHVVQVEYKSVNGETHFSRSIVTAAKKVAAKIPGYCEEVYHFNIKKGFDPTAGGDYALLTEHTGDDFARTSLPLAKEIVFGNKSLYGEFVKPAMDKLKESIKSEPPISKF